MTRGTVYLESDGARTATLDELNDMRQEEILCDVVLQSGDDAHPFPVHSCVVAASSLYIRSTLINLCQEQTRTTFIIHLPNIRRIVLENIISFIYQGKLCFATSELENIKDAAEFLVMNNLHQTCLRLLKEATGGGDATISSATHEDQQQLSTRTESVSHEIPGEITVRKTVSAKQLKSTDGDENLHVSVRAKNSIFQTTTLSQPETSAPCDAIAHSEHQEQQELDVKPKIVMTSQSKNQPEALSEVTSATANQMQTGTVSSHDSLDPVLMTSFDGNFILHVDEQNSCEVKLEETEEGLLTQGSQLSLLEAGVNSKASQDEEAMEGEDPEGSAETLYGCEFCDSVFETVNELNHHYMSHTDDGSFVCLQCHQSFPQKSALLAHIALQHRASMGVKADSLCTVCGKEFSTVSNLRAHMKLHVRLFTCLYCTQTFKLRKDLKAHVEMEHNDVSMEQPLSREDADHEYYKCPKCSKTFSLASRLRAHTEAVHDKMKRFWCNEKDCTYGSYWRSDLKGHMKYHQSEKMCRRGSFKTLAAESKTFMCTLCHAILFGMKAFRQHTSLHEQSEGLSETQPQPSTCEDGVTSSGDTSTLPVVPKEVYLCNLCNAVLQSKEGLDKHAMIHQPVRQVFECEVCRKQFFHKSHLRTHMAVKHGNEKRYECQEPECSFSCYYFSEITRHYHTKHGSECPSKEMLEVHPSNT